MNKNCHRVISMIFQNMSINSLMTLSTLGFFSLNFPTFICLICPKPANCTLYFQTSCFASFSASVLLPWNAAMEQESSAGINSSLLIVFAQNSFHLDSTTRTLSPTSSVHVKISGKGNTALPPPNKCRFWNSNEMPGKHIKKFLYLEKLFTFKMK